MIASHFSIVLQRFLPSRALPLSRRDSGSSGRCGVQISDRSREDSAKHLSSVAKARNCCGRETARASLACGRNTEKFAVRVRDRLWHEVGDHSAPTYDSECS